MKCDDLAVCEKGFTRVKSAALDMAFNPIMSALNMCDQFSRNAIMCFLVDRRSGGMWLTKLHTA